MAALLFRLRNVPDDEANAVRKMLTDNNVDFYETDAGNWGISMPAIWIHDDSMLADCQILVAQWQSEYARTARAEYLRRKQEGLEPSLLDKIRQHPFVFLLTVSFSIFILYVMLVPIWKLFN